MILFYFIKIAGRKKNFAATENYSYKLKIYAIILGNL